MISDEEFIDLTTATHSFPIRMSRKTIERLVRDNKLESIKIAGRRYTSKEAIARFLEKSLSGPGDEKPPLTQPQARMSKVEMEKKEPA